MLKFGYGLSSPERLGADEIEASAHEFPLPIIKLTVEHGNSLHRCQH